MRSFIRFDVSMTVAILSAACLTGQAIGADHATPLTSTPKRAYLRGNHINQTFVQPEANVATVPDASATAGHVSGLAATNHLMNHAPNRARLEKQLTQNLKSQTRIKLNHADAPAPGVAAAPAAPASLYKFTYSYHYKDVPLWKYSTQSQLIRAKGDSRKLLYVRERNLPKLDQLGDTQPTVKADDATKIGLDDSRDATRAQIAVDQKNEAPHREIHVDPDGKPTLAWAFVVRSTERARPFARRYWVSALDDARVLDKEDLIFHAGSDVAQQGKVVGNLVGFRKSPLDPPDQDQGLDDFTIFENGSTIVTDANGFFSFSTPGTFNTRLTGPYCTIINEAGPLLVPTRTGNTLAFKATTEQELAQVSAFKWVSIAHAFVKDYLPSNADRLVSLPTHVNIDDSCNAFFDPNEHTLNFFKSGDGCLNSAYCDVACHEFGHAVDDQFGDILDGGYSEGFGDALAILITRDSVIGRDFQGRGQNLRDAKDIFTWPPPDPEVHEVGRIYAGFAWELTRQLTSKLGSEDKAFDAAKNLILGAAALNPKDTPDAVRLSFLVDGQNGSTFFQELAAAADSRNIPRPDSPGTVNDPKFLASGVK
jgi:hypothetical protein